MGISSDLIRWKQARLQFEMPKSPPTVIRSRLSGAPNAAIQSLFFFFFFFEVAVADAPFVGVAARQVLPACPRRAGVRISQAAACRALPANWLRVESCSETGPRAGAYIAGANMARWLGIYDVRRMQPVGIPKQSALRRAAIHIYKMPV